MAEQMYKQSGGQPTGDPSADFGGGAAGGDPTQSQKDVIDAEFEEKK